MLLSEKLKKTAHEVQKIKPEWTEENWHKSHLNMIISRLELQSTEGFHSFYCPYLTESEEGYLRDQGLNVTKKEKKCDCKMGNGWYVDWFEEGDLEEFQREVDEIYDEE